MREHGETRLVSIATAESARAGGVDLTVIHAAENGGEGDVARAEELLRTSSIPPRGLGADSSLEDEEVAPLWRCLMKALVEGRMQDADICWRALRGTMQCVLQKGYEQGWETTAVEAGPSSPTKFVQSASSCDIKKLDDAQKAPTEEFQSELIFSPDCRYVAEYGNSMSGGGASFTFDEYKVLVYDTTTGICVHEQSRRETQGWCSPYRRSGGSIRAICWPGPRTLRVTWSDGLQDEKAFESNVSSFHFTPYTWSQ
jgi:hypothetical protein